MTREDADFNTMLIREEVNELLSALSTNNDLTELCDAYFDVLWVVTQSAMLNGLNINDLCRAGFYSNMSKFCNTYEEALDTVEAYAKGEHPAKYGTQIECRIDENRDGSFTVKRASDSKILKSINFKEPDFSFIVQRAKEHGTV
jgi:hypothetical protein